MSSFQRLKYSFECGFGNQKDGVSILVLTLMSWMIIGQTLTFSLFSHLFFQVSLLKPFLEGVRCLDGVESSLNSS